MNVRERASLLADEIGRDLPDFTRHDLSHLDALWYLADSIAGVDVELNPAESYVLAGAFLTHDLGLALAAHPGGAEALREDPRWRDAIALELRARLGRAPTAAEIDDADADVERAAQGALLRQLHAERAEQLATVCWTDENGRQLYLVEDSVLRDAYGRLIGRIAHSHWWPASDLPDAFTASLAAPTPFPPEWIVEPLRLACLLRLADACHLDASRAPALLQIFRRPAIGSLNHWRFQSKLHQPRARGDRIEFTSGQPFDASDATAWWLAYDLLRVADRELHAVDALLADLDRQRFALRGVSAVEDPLRLARLIETDGWLPVDALIRVTDVPRLVRQLGGEELYGNDKRVALRELIQNGIDAVRARRLLECRSDTWGSITVRLRDSDAGCWLEVGDTGVGMSPDVLTSTLLDFGASLWASSDLVNEFPGLAGRGFSSIGRFGIGFFSVFMLASQVEVISRRAERARDETYVLEFKEGVDERPLLRTATTAEQLIDGGTRVRLLLNEPPREEGGILLQRRTRPPYSLTELCEELAPASAVDICVEDDSGVTVAIEAGDWQTLDSERLLARVFKPWDEDDDRGAELDRVAPHLRLLTNSDGNVVGRAAVGLGRAFGLGTVTVGGLWAGELNLIVGLLEASVETAARDVAIPLVERDVLAAWATEQAQLLAESEASSRELATAAHLVARCGGATGELPIARAGDGWQSYAQVKQWAEQRDEIVAVQAYEFDREIPVGSVLTIAGDVLLVEGGFTAVLPVRGDLFSDWPSDRSDLDGYPLYQLLAVLGGPSAYAIADAWAVDLNDLIGAVEHRPMPEREVFALDGRPVTSTRYALVRRADN